MAANYPYNKYLRVYLAWSTDRHRLIQLLIRHSDLWRECELQGNLKSPLARQVR